MLTPAGRGASIGEGQWGIASALAGVAIELLRTVGGRLLGLIPIIVLVSIATFGLLQLVPGDPAVAVLGPDASQAEYAAVRTQLGVDRPLVEQFTEWAGDVATGNFGNSLFPPRQSVTDLIRQRLPVTIEVAALSLLLSLAIALPVALYSAFRPSARFDRVATTLTFATISIPGFLAGLLIVFFFVFRRNLVRLMVVAIGVLAVAAVVRWGWRRMQRLAAERHELSDDDPDRAAVDVERRRTLRWTIIGALVCAVGFGLTALLFPQFPRQGFVRLTDGGLAKNLRSVALPVLMLAVTESAVFIRLLRADLMTTLGEDYILSARAKGMPPWRILVRDALRPSCFSLITVISVTIGRVIGGTVIAETIFNLPGMGRLILDAISRRNYPVVQASVLLIALVYVVTSLLVDVTYTYLDPRIRRGRV